ncbi:hypothetical protein [Streptomyces sp. NPDC001070]
MPAEYSAGIPAGLTGPARNVAALYTDLARDLREGTRTVPDFAHALARHRLLGVIEDSSSQKSARTAG